jgi:hypothetical protein
MGEKHGRWSVCFMFVRFFYMPFIHDMGPRDRRLRIFITLKTPSSSAGFEPANFGSSGKHATTRPPRAPPGLVFRYFFSTLVIIIIIFLEQLREFKHSTVSVYFKFGFKVSHRRVCNCRPTDSVSSTTSFTLHIFRRSVTADNFRTVY